MTTRRRIEFDDGPAVRKTGKRLSAYDFANEVGVTSGGIRFGIDMVKCAATLRKLVNDFETGQCLLQNVEIHTGAAREDYPMTVLVLKFHEKEPQ